MELLAVGLNHKTAPIEVREKLYFSPSEIQDSLIDFKKNNLSSESLILSTCNRTEFYIVSNSKTDELFNYISNFILAKKGVNYSDYERCLYIYDFENSVRHIYEVASGIDSMAIGEHQILNQIKQAYMLSSNAKTSGIILHKLINKALWVGKRVRNETEISSGATSISGIAVELAKKIFTDVSLKSTLLIGSGETAELTAQILKDEGVKNLFITNRTFSNAESLAKKFSAVAIPFEDLQNALSKVDIVISATSSSEPILRFEQMKKVMNLRHHKPIFIVDIAVPRDFEPEISKIYNVFLYSIDDLKVIAEKNLAKRAQEIPKVKSIIDDEVRKFMLWVGELKITPLIQKLIEKIENIRNAEVQKIKRDFSSEDFTKIDILTKNIINKILHEPITKLKELNEESEISLLQIELFKNIFTINEKDEKNNS